MSEWIGWLATTIFAVSYFVRNPVSMRWVQAAAALCWMTYGIMLHARPVIVANVIVAELGEGDPAKVAIEAKKAARSCWREFADSVFEAYRQQGIVNSDIWNDQVDDVIEF